MLNIYGIVLVKIIQGGKYYIDHLKWQIFNIDKSKIISLHELDRDLSETQGILQIHFDKEKDKMNFSIGFDPIPHLISYFKWKLIENQPPRNFPRRESGRCNLPCLLWC